MYSKLLAEDFIRKIGLPTKYKVDGLLAYGVWDLYAEEKHLPHFRNALIEMGISTEIKRFENADIGHAYEFTISGKTYWFVPVMGTAMMASYAHFASVLGSRKNILIGVVGGLAHGMKSADFILPSMILGNENALKYQPTATDRLFYPSDALRDRIKKRLPIGQKIWEGKTITCESILAETEEDVALWSEEGYLGVEMEGGLMFALSNHFRIPSVALFYVSDNLIEGETLLHESHKASKAQREISRAIQYRVAVEELLSE